MSAPRTVRAPRHSLLAAQLFLMLFGFGCGLATTVTATPSPDNNSVQVLYPTGIETRRLDNGVIAVLDHKGHYFMGFGEKWQVGAFHEDFLPTVEKYAQINLSVKSIFEVLYQNDSSLRIYAVDTSPEHLTDKTATVIYIGMFQDQQHLQATLNDMAADLIENINSDGRLEVTRTLAGESNYAIPFIILLTESRSKTDTPFPVYGASVLIKTEEAYLEMSYITFDGTIDIIDELNPILASFVTFVE
ncbi:MAG: hypothetical protein FD146_1537 [Anaerolineaceae bacterium]|nr:MAG: hypothetical protein FD146_1537 [Anaerolineaceae bacterium]